MRAWLVAATAALLTASAGLTADQPADWSRPIPPFQIIGNVYYVGTEGLAAYLVAGPEGHVLIDGALPSSPPLIVRNIARLGFRPGDVKVLLINHAHFDHAGGLAGLKRLTGARLAASAGDKASLEAGRTLGRPELDSFPPVKVDRVIADGDEVRLGPLRLAAILTPGHTPGAVTWATMASQRRVIFASSLTVAGQPIAGSPAADKAAADFRRTFDALRGTRADVFLNFHPESFDLKAKRARQQAGQAEAFVDPTELRRQVDAAERAFDAEWARQSAPPS